MCLYNRVKLFKRLNYCQAFEDAVRNVAKKALSSHCHLFNVMMVITL